MAKKTVNIGTSVNKGNGDPLRTAFGKINDNFDEIYGAIGTNGTIFNPLNVDSHILPDADNTRDLGSPAKRWRDIFVAPGSLYIGDIKLSNDNGKLVATKVINPGEANEAPDPIDSDAGSEIGSGGNAFDQSLNTADSVTFNSVGATTVNVSQINGTNPGDELVIQADNNNWNFGTGGALTFPQGTTIATADGSDAFIIQGAADKDIQIYTISGPTPTAHGWTFGADGSLTFPTGGLISNYPGGVGVNDDSWFVTPGNGTGGVSSQDGQQYIQINNNLHVEIGTSYGTENESIWQFGRDGDLTLPAGGDIKDSEGNSVLGGGAGDSLTSNDDINITVNSEDSSSYTWNFGQTGILTTPDDIIAGSVGDGGRFIQDCDNGTTSMRWINVTINGNGITELIRAYSGDPDGEGSSAERAQVSVNWLDDYQSGLTIRAFDRTDANNTVEHDWQFQGDGSIKFPDNTVQTTAYTGQNSGAMGTFFVVVNEDGTVSKSTDGVSWTTGVDLGSSISRVATNGVTVAMIQSDQLSWTTFAGLEASTYVSGSSGTNDEIGGETVDWNQIDYAGGYFVAVGRYTPTGTEFSQGVYGYSTDGRSWTFETVDQTVVEFFANDPVDSDWQFSDVDYNGVGWMFSVSDINGGNVNGGGVYITDLTATVTSARCFSTNITNRAAWNGSAWYMEGSAPGDGNLAGVNTNLDPRNGTFEGPIDPWATAIQDLGIDAGSTTELAGGNGYIAAGDSDGHVAWSDDNGQTWQIVTPIPYTRNISLITQASPAVVTDSGGSGTGANGEKVVISGSSVSGYNGTFYWKSANSSLYTDQALTTPFDTSGLAAFTGTATLAWSNGEYIDAMDYINGYFYIGNDDDQIARTTDFVSWTIVDDQANDFDYWNDIAGFVSTESDRLVSGSKQVILDTDGDLTIPGDIKSENDINITVDSGDSSAYTWNFGQTGTLTAPGMAVFGGTDGIVVDNLNEGIAALFNNGDVYITGGESLRFTGLDNIEGESSSVLRFWNGEGRHSSGSDATELVTLNVGNDADSGDPTLGFFKIITEKQVGGEKEWKFDADGDLTLPPGGDIKDSEGNSVLGGGDANVWVQTFETQSGAPTDIVSIAISVEYDSAGNVIALFSHFNDDNNATYYSVGKYTTTGAKIWTARFDDEFYTDGWGLAVDNDSNSIYVAGETDVEGQDNATLTKIDAADGSVIWSKIYDFGFSSQNSVVDVASDGNPVMVGYASNGTDDYVATTKVDAADGSVIWSRALDGQADEEAYGMAVGPTGEVVAIGFMEQLGVTDAAATLYTDPVSNANWTINQTGVLAGALEFDVSFAAGVPTFANIVDPEGGRTVDDTVATILGSVLGGADGVDDIVVKVATLAANEPDNRMLVVKYDSAGSIQWQKAILFDEGFDCKGADADIDSAGNIYVTGSYQYSFDEGTTSALSILKLNGNGVKQWSRRVTGDCDTFGISVVVGPDDKLYLSGVTGNDANSEYTWVAAKYGIDGTVEWQRLIDNTTGWTFTGAIFFGDGAGSNIAVKDGYVLLGGGFGDLPNGDDPQATLVQVAASGDVFSVGDWDFKAASFSGVLSADASDITVVNAGKTDTDNSENITTGTVTLTTEVSGFLLGTLYSTTANNRLINGANDLVLEANGALTLPSGGTISEGVVTSNPTIQLTPASPTVASQKLVIKGGSNYNFTDNGITLSYQDNTANNGDSLDFYINGASTYANQTLYWWIYPESAGLTTPSSGTVALDGNGGGGPITVTVDNDNFEFTVRVSPEQDNYDPANVGVESGLINGDAPAYGDHHLHLTTGDLTETSIFLGTDDHNVRTTTDGNIEITTPNATNKVWEFDTDGNLTIPGNIRSENAINIEVNLSDSTLRRWRFSEGGDLTLPAGGDILDSNGESFLKDIPQNSPTGYTVNPYVLQASDRGRHILIDGSEGNSIEIPTDATEPMPVGSAIVLVIKPGEYTVFVSAEDLGAMVIHGAGVGSNMIYELDPGTGGAMATLVKIGANEWMISGTGLAEYTGP